MACFRKVGLLFKIAGNHMHMLVQYCPCLYSPRRRSPCLEGLFTRFGKAVEVQVSVELVC
jgi:hypothetical protein